MQKLAQDFRVASGKSFRLKDFNPGHAAEGISKEEGQEMLKESSQLISDLQEKLYAQSQWALLLIFQAMDAGGKDGTIKHVMSGINPQGCQVFSFKQPSLEELNHDFLWRTMRAMPERGKIGIFNRSYYEEVLVIRVHKDLLAKQNLPPHLVTEKIWQERFEDISALERYLGRNGIVVRKFFLNMSKEEQKKRFLSRLDQPEKNWKFSDSDVRERKYWNDYMEAYEDTIKNTSSSNAPWYIVPADRKWLARLVVSSVIIETLESLHLSLPKIDAARTSELQEARRSLEREEGASEKKK
ncbi:MAG TPA: polyphosphate kinase 2 family protein [Candidatus Angelobacter sp.]|nr:polyphosphate kinase 2 family protein [Candidatus Angelobacter sp.]